MKTTTFFKVFAIAVSLFTCASADLLAQVKVGNNPGSINSSAALEIESTNKGFLPPRVALQSTSDVTTIPSPVAGLTVYNTTNAGSNNTAVKANQLYIWNGTRWDVFQTQSLQATSGVITKKLLQQSQWPDGTKTVIVEDIEFRLQYAVGTGGGDSGGIIQARLVTPPPTTLSIGAFANNVYVPNYYTTNLINFQFSVANNWTDIASPFNTADTGTINQTGEVRTTRFAYNGKVYLVDAFAAGPAGANNTWVLIVSIY